MSPTGVGNGPNFVHEVYKSGNLSKPVASFWLNYDDNEIGSSVTFGGVDPSAYKGKIHYDRS
jgi:hypothetical protein